MPELCQKMAHSGGFCALTTPGSTLVNVALLGWLTWFCGLLRRVRGGVRAAFVDEFVVVVGIIRANEFLQTPGRAKLELPVPRPGLRVRFRVLDGEVEFQGLRLRPPKPFDYMQLVGVRKARAVDPSLLVETNRVNHEGVSFIPANRIAHPRRVRVFGMLPPVRV